MKKKEISEKTGEVREKLSYSEILIFHVPNQFTNGRLCSNDEKNDEMSWICSHGSLTHSYSSIHRGVKPTRPQPVPDTS